MNDKDTPSTIDTARPRTPVTIITNAARFSPGQIVATPGALALLEKTGFSAAALLGRHLHGDWGCCCREDAQTNEYAVAKGYRIMSVYRLVDAEKLRATPEAKRANLPTIWCITDGTNDAGRREVTTLLLPGDY